MKQVKMSTESRRIRANLLFNDLKLIKTHTKFNLECGFLTSDLFKFKVQSNKDKDKQSSFVLLSSTVSTCQVLLFTVIYSCLHKRSISSSTPF